MNGYLQHVESDDDHPVSVADATLKQLVQELSFRAFLDRTYHGTELVKAGFPDIIKKFEDIATDKAFETRWRWYGETLEKAHGLVEALRKLFK